MWWACGRAFIIEATGICECISDGGFVSHACSRKDTCPGLFLRERRTCSSFLFSTTVARCDRGGVRQKFHPYSHVYLCVLCDVGLLSAASLGSGLGRLLRGTAAFVFCRAGRKVSAIPRLVGPGNCTLWLRVAPCLAATLATITVSSVDCRRQCCRTARWRHL